MDDTRELILKMQGEIDLLKQSDKNKEKEISELKTQTELSKLNIQEVNLNLVKVSKDIENHNKAMVDLTTNMEKLTNTIQSMNEEPKEFNKTLKIATVSAIVTALVTGAGALLIWMIKK